MKYSKSFIKFIENSSRFNTEEKREIIEHFHDKNIYLVFNLSILLFVWSITMFFVDLFLISGLAISLFMFGMSVNFFIIIPLTFLLLNIVFKYLTISFIANGRIKCYILLVSSLPYIGFAFLLGHTLRKKKIFRRAISSYIEYKRKSLNIFRKNKK